MSGKPVRVLHVSAYFAPAFCYGGPPRSIFGLCHSLVRAGADVEVFTTTANGAQRLAAAPGGVSYHGVRVRYFPLDWRGFGWHARGLAASLAREAQNADLVHVHGLWNFTAWAGFAAADRVRVPYVISPRGMLQPEAMNHHRLAKAVAFETIEHRHVAGAALLHATSDAEAHALQRFGPRVALVANGVEAPRVDAEQIAAVRRALDLSPDAEVVTFLGRLHPIKRLDLVAEAFIRLRRSGRRATLVIAGPDEGGHRRQIEPLFHQVAADVRWAGAIGDDKWALLAASRALVQCSDSESFGLSVAEALASGVPVVVTDRGAWPQIASIGAGHLVAHDGGAISDALDRLLADRAGAQAMGERGRAWVARTLGWDGIARAMLAEYDAVLGRRRAAAS